MPAARLVVGAIILAKPKECAGCPLLGDGYGFVPDALVEGSRVLFLFQNPGENEEQGKRIVGYDKVQTGVRTKSVPITEPVPPQPVIGATGYEMDKHYLPRTFMKREQVSIANVLKCRWQRGGERTNDLPTGQLYKDAVAHCTAAHLRVPESVELVVACGKHALDFTQGGDASIPVSEWRGFLAPRQWNGRPVLASLHLADLFREPRMRGAVRMDWAKIPRFLDRTWPQPMPAPEYDMRAFFDRLWPLDTRLVIDTEYTMPDKRLTLVGLGYRDDDGRIHVYQRETYGWTPLDEAFVELLKRAVREKRTGFQNCQADIPVLQDNLQIGAFADYKQIDDVMLAHFLLWSELPHDLGFLASLFSPYGKTKHLSKTDQLLYNRGDVVDTLVALEAVVDRELKGDPNSARVYQEQALPLVPILEEAERIGIRVSKARVLPAIKAYADKMKEAMAIARAYAGWPINLGSPAHLTHWLYDVEKLAVQKNKKTKGRTVNDDAMAVLRKHVGPAYDEEDEELNGLTVSAALAQMDEGGHPLLLARVIYAKAGQIVSHYLKPLVKDAVAA